MTDLSKAWRIRFQFFQANGVPGMWKPNKAYQQAFRALPFRTRMTVSSNFFAFFFGWFYLLYLGLWRKALTMFAIGVALGIASILLQLPNILDTALTFGLCGFISARANVLYYDYRVHGRHTWDL
ncbi:DUF2628 domain-containing protein [Prescottella defluvii]|nr:DUF2628 domain-containing protein [Prescottella defluvii]